MAGANQQNAKRTAIQRRCRTLKHMSKHMCKDRAPDAHTTGNQAVTKATGEVEPLSWQQSTLQRGTQYQFRGQGEGTHL